AWPVSEYILVAYLDSNFCSDIGQVMRIVDSERPAATNFGDVIQEGWPQPLFLSRQELVIKANRIDHYVGFLNERLDLPFRVAAMIVATIRNNEKGLFWVLRLPHLADAQINGIQKGCAAFRNREQELAFDVLHG